jgi:hypothetical protein
MSQIKNKKSRNCKDDRRARYARKKARAAEKNKAAS